MKHPGKRVKLGFLIMDTQLIQNLLVTYRKKKSEKTKDRLLNELKPLVSSIAKKFLYVGESYKDLQQVGMIGLLKVLDGYQLDRDAKVLSYISKKVIGEIKHYFRDSFKMIKVPRKYFKIYYDMNKYVQSYIQKNKGNSPTVQQIARSLGESEEVILETMEVMHSCSLLTTDKSLIKTIVNEQQSYDNRKEMISSGAVSDFEEKVDNLVLLSRIMDILSFREKKILQLYYGDNMTQKEIADRFNISQVYVFRIINKALARCRKALDKERGRL